MTEYRIDYTISRRGPGDDNFKAACNCVLSGGDLLPFSCQLHGIPCEDCGGLESCAPNCGDEAADPSPRVPLGGVSDGGFDSAGGAW